VEPAAEATVAVAVAVVVLVVSAVVALRGSGVR
jgi:hypothetical protein